MIRQVEKLIAKRVIADALAAGFALGVNDGEETVLENSTNPDAVLAAMFSTDDDHLLFYKDGKRVGWVRFIYGNSGYDVVNDYTVNLEPVMVGATKLADEWSD